MHQHDILISGAGVAGPAVAYWLARYGHRPTIVERAPAIREAGQAVDFRGDAHLTVLTRMGILDAVRRHAAPGGAVAFVDERGEPIATMSAEIASGDLEILRGDLGHILFDASADTTEYIFDDFITGIEQTRDSVRVTFARNAPRRFDAVIGADGIHSAVRALAFGQEDRFVRHLGHYVAIASIDDSSASQVAGNGGKLYSVPGRTAGISRAGGATRAIFYFASPPLSYDRNDADAQKQLVANAFAGVGWETPRLLTAMRAANEFYFDSISDVRMPTLSNGRVVLLGDAGYGGTIGGMGTGLAVVAAYILAGEIASADGDFSTAFHRYEQLIHDYARQCQRGAGSVGTFMAPKTRLGVAARNLALRLSYLMPGKGMMERIATRRASAVTLLDYPRADRTSAELLNSVATIAPARIGGP